MNQIDMRGENESKSRSGTFGRVDRNALRILASVKMIELNLGDAV